MNNYGDNSFISVAFYSFSKAMMKHVKKLFIKIFAYLWCMLYFRGKISLYD